MEVLVLALKAFAVACGIVGGIIAAPFVIAFVGAAVLSVLYMAAALGDWMIDSWRNRRLWR